METMIDNSLVTVDWQQITDKIDQLNQLKNKPDAVGEMISVANGLHSLLLHYSVQAKSTSNINSSKRVAVVMPSIYGNSVKVTTIQNQEKEIMEEEVKAYGEPIDLQNERSAETEQASVKEATVEEPVLESLSKIKEMEEPVVESQQELPASIESKEDVVLAPEEVEDVVSTPEESPESDVKKEVEVAPVTKDEPVKKETTPTKQYSIWEAYSSNEVPTLAQQQATQQAAKIEPVQDKEDASYNKVTAGMPIKDLKKAISISDRYLFINELFRGEESEYERSIKTINNFNVYQEARYWIDRELKVKLGWDDKSSIVKQFNNLVQRRFA
ncbi:MAG: hypothetical protein DI598_15415 [Pseudopedobacter saltans]|uniref:Uncharacterized protein n=1 Tax=Pseudopedobacter saltans TaxID=151895 RepID=A0A2W5EP14_9SPHI|nr:MAG: hypothetical protein DI598_15415 [Pseudopedobacter saltans]